MKTFFSIFFIFIFVSIYSIEYGEIKNLKSCLDENAEYIQRILLEDISEIDSDTRSYLYGKMMAYREISMFLEMLDEPWYLNISRATFEQQYRIIY